jgi:hypothetical protein
MSDQNTELKEALHNITQVSEKRRRRVAELEQQNAGLLAALDAAVAWAKPMEAAPVDARPVWFDQARSAIAKAQDGATHG